MLETTELLTLLMGCGVGIFLVANFRGVMEAGGGDLLCAFAALLSGWIFGVAEGFVLDGLFNLLEHLCYATSAIFVLSHCIRRDDEHI